MSALGHKQTLALQNVMSALPPKADMTMFAMRRSLIPILIIVCAFIAFPPLVHELFPPKLPAAELIVHDSPRRFTDFSFLDWSWLHLSLYHFLSPSIFVKH